PTSTWAYALKIAADRSSAIRCWHIAQKQSVTSVAPLPSERALVVLSDEAGEDMVGPRLARSPWTARHVDFKICVTHTYASLIRRACPTRVARPPDDCGSRAVLGRVRRASRPSPRRSPGPRRSPRT